MEFNLGFKGLNRNTPATPSFFLSFFVLSLPFYWVTSWHCCIISCTSSITILEVEHLELSVFSSDVLFSNKRIDLWSIILVKILKDGQVMDMIQYMMYMLTAIGFDTRWQ